VTSRTLLAVSIVPGHGLVIVSWGRLSGWASSECLGGLALWLWSSLDICSGARCQDTRNYPAKETHRRKQGSSLRTHSCPCSHYHFSLLLFGSCQWAKVLHKNTSGLGNNAWQKKKRLKWHNEARETWPEMI